VNNEGLAHTLVISGEKQAVRINQRVCSDGMNGLNLQVIGREAELSEQANLVITIAGGLDERPAISVNRATVKEVFITGTMDLEITNSTCWKLHVE